jgi:undecaprenyl-diphosphatase
VATIIHRPRLVALVLGWRQSKKRIYVGKLAVVFLVTSVLGLVAKRRALHCVA